LAIASGIANAIMIDRGSGSGWGWLDYDNSGMAGASDANEINKHIKCDLQRCFEHRALCLYMKISFRLR